LDLTAAPDLSLFVDDELQATIVLALNPDTGSFDELSMVEVDGGLATSLSSLGAIPTEANDSGEEKFGRQAALRTGRSRPNFL
jgi:hypothetical protein